MHQGKNSTSRGQQQPTQFTHIYMTIYRGYNSITSRGPSCIVFEVPKCQIVRVISGQNYSDSFPLVGHPKDGSWKGSGKCPTKALNAALGILGKFAQRSSTVWKTPLKFAIDTQHSHVATEISLNEASFLVSIREISGVLNPPAWYLHSSFRDYQEDRKSLGKPPLAKHDLISGIAWIYWAKWDLETASTWGCQRP